MGGRSDDENPLEICTASELISPCRSESNVSCVAHARHRGGAIIPYYSGVVRDDHPENIMINCKPYISSVDMTCTRFSEFERAVREMIYP